MEHQDQFLVQDILEVVVEVVVMLIIQPIEVE